nr:hypothetical protein ANI_1_3240024 [Aspergillus niger CBS 513.88]|eukprot:XP_001400464.2 hypothetical protein ANI_1_3240024 [Aspergillus niger CBS 513.88]
MDSRKRDSRTYVEELEKRIERMQEQLESMTRSGIGIQRGVENTRRSRSSSPGQSVESTTDYREPEDPADGDNIPGMPQVPPDKGLHPSAENDQSIVIDSQDGKMRYFGASSAFSALTDAKVNGLETQPHTGNWRHAAQRSAHPWQLSNWIPHVLQDGLERRIFEPLPCKDTTVQLAREYFATFNHAIPLFEEASFMRSVDRQYSWNPDDSASWWISLNIALAISYRERAHAYSSASDNWKKSLGHVKNALNAVVDVFLRNTDIAAVQGLLGLALYFQAMRLAQSIGLHRENASGASPEAEQRRRVYWIAFILDSDISIRVGRPPVQDIEDYDTHLPTENPPDGRGVLTIDGTRINYFRLLAQLAQIQRLVIRQLYTVTVRQKSSDDVNVRIKSCEDALLSWKKSINSKLQPQRTFSYAGDDLSMVQNVVRFLTSTSSEEPNTYVDFILGMCSDLERSARRAFMTAQPARHHHPATMQNNENDRPSRSSHGINQNTVPNFSDALPTSLGSTSAANMGSTHFTNMVPQGPYSDIGFPESSNEVDLSANWQWSLPPFWNWQDLASVAPLFSVVPGVDVPEANMPDT